MHNALYQLTIMPIFLSRSTISIILNNYKGLRKFIPVDDFIKFHMNSAIYMFLFLWYGYYVWMVTMERLVDNVKIMIMQ